MKSKSLKIVKIGSSILSDRKLLHEFLLDFSHIRENKVLVHGGGRHATELARKLNVPVKMNEGRRITCADTLDVITMSYAGKINKNIVAQLQAMDCNAMGFTGADGNLIKAEKRPVSAIDYGFVGDIVSVENELIAELLGWGITPVFCAVTHDKKGNLLNTNADTVASELALGMAVSYETELFYCSEKAGVLENLNDPESVITTINTASYEEIKRKKLISDGMIPKLDNCLHALRHNVRRIYIGDHKLLKLGNKLFTTIEH